MERPEVPLARGAPLAPTLRPGSPAEVLSSGSVTVALASASQLAWNQPGQKWTVLALPSAPRSSGKGWGLNLSSKNHQINGGQGAAAVGRMKPDLNQK